MPVLALLVVAVACGPQTQQAPTPPRAAQSPNPQPASSPAAQSQQGSATTMQWSNPPEMQIDPSKRYTALIATSMGDISIDLLTDDAPKTVNNFVFLARQNFYDNVKFHRIIKGFMIQTGDPEGTGRGGPGYRFADEPVKRRYTKGIVAMANAGANTNGSQFFIVHGQDAGLPPNYTIFGQVTSGIDVVDKIADVPVGGPENSSPQQDVRITKVTIQEQ
jgi:cyclophilin family peptidyl-prolyl cis-trans isomerase